jgi:hypothetical protein
MQDQLGDISFWMESKIMCFTDVTKSPERLSNKKWRIIVGFNVSEVFGSSTSSHIDSAEMFQNVTDSVSEKLATEERFTTFQLTRCLHDVEGPLNDINKN